MKTLVFRAAVFVLAAATLIAAVSGLRAQPDRIALSSFEIARQYLGADIAARRALAAAAASRHEDDCLADFRRGALALAVDALPAGSDGGGDPLEALRRAASARLRCAPTDGNAWLLLARAVGADVPAARVAAYVKASGQVAPAEGWIIEGRLSFICGAPAAVQSALAGRAEADASRLLAGRRFAAMAAIYDRCSEQTRAIIDQALAAAGPELRAAYARVMAGGLD